MAGTAALALAACVTTTTRSFLPSPQNPRYTTTSAAPVLAEYVRLQCAGLRQAHRADSGTARFAVETDSAGVATRADLVRGTNDEMLDGVFGTVAAQLTLAPTAAADTGGTGGTGGTGAPATRAASRARRIPVDIGWRCHGDGAVVNLRPVAVR